MKSIKLLLQVGFVTLFAFILLQSSILYWIMNQNSTQVDNAINGDFSSSLLISRMAIEANKLRRYEKEYFIYIGNQEKMAKYENEWEKSYNNLEMMLDQALHQDKGQWSPSELNTVESWLVSLKGYGHGFQRVLEKVKEGILTDTLSANHAIVNAKKRFKILLNGTELGGEQRYNKASAAIQVIEKNNKILMIALIGTTLAVLLIVLIMLFKIPSAINGSIKTLSESANTISMGNLDEMIPIYKIKNEFLTIAHSLERMRISQKTFVDKLKGGKL